MVGLAIVCSGIFALVLPDAPEADEPAQAVPTIQGQFEADQSKALGEYNGMRTKTPQTAAAQWKLGVWCEKHGLTAESYTHFATVVRLDPTREAAWRRLGYKKRGKRWMSDAEVADDAEQKKADKIWTPQLRKWHKDIHGGKQQRETQDALDAVKDPRAVPAIYREFANGGKSDQMILVQALGKLEAPLSSKLLAFLAIYGKSPEVRRIATETLRGRNPDEFLEVLVALLTDPVKYEVKPVGGPGSPGVLFVEGKKFNTRRIYSTPVPPVLSVQPGDIVSYDAFGMPVIDRPNGLYSASTTVLIPGPRLNAALNSIPKKDVGIVSISIPTESQSITSTTRFSLTEEILEAQRAAATSQAQLASDVAALDSMNQARNRFNELVMNVARDATGKDPGTKPDDWRNLTAERKAYRRRTANKPTYDDVVPLAYNPVFGQLNLVHSLIRSTTTYDVDT